jgi:hypothetical protein
MATHFYAYTNSDASLSFRKTRLCFSALLVYLRFLAVLYLPISRECQNQRGVKIGKSFIFIFWLLPMYLSMEVDSQIKSLENPCLFDSERSCGFEGEFIAQVFLQ